VGLCAAAAQEWLLGPGDGATFVRYWLVVAAACAALGGGAAIAGYLWREDEFARRRTRTVLGQFVPSLAAGAALTFGLVRHGQAELLPGLWAIVFGLGIFSMRPYLPRAIGWVGAFYLACGAGLLAQGLPLAPWQVGGVFGVGHLATALVLHLNLERNKREQGDS
jgi:hypothetical protein